MTEQEARGLACSLSAVCVFRRVILTDAMTALIALLSEGDETKKTSLFGEFVYSLRDDGYSLSDFLCRAIYTDENAYIVGTAQKKTLSPALVQNAEEELRLFSALTKLSNKDFFPSSDFSYLPQFENRYVDFPTTYRERMTNLSLYGYGMFATAKMFRVAGEEILPVYAADKITENDFVGYEEEREKVFRNTEALVLGKHAANVLLFGDAGTGKSSTVKACANRFADRGVRLIELRKDQLFALSHIMEKIADNPLKFIIFIDDLSFNKNDDSFSMLKAALEGSASAKAKNAVIYATSNRRHIVKETFSDRATADDLHHSDTVQELLSLSDRFGLTVYFERPTKSLYLSIVHELAKRNGITLDEKELDIRAEAFALQKGSRSPRAAEQFIHSLL